jgi:hypothetical protein
LNETFAPLVVFDSMSVCGSNGLIHMLWLSPCGTGTFECSTAVN